MTSVTRLADDAGVFTPLADVGARRLGATRLTRVLLEHVGQRHRRLGLGASRRRGRRLRIRRRRRFIGGGRVLRGRSFLSHLSSQQHNDTAYLRLVTSPR